MTDSEKSDCERIEGQKQRVFKSRIQQFRDDKGLETIGERTEFGGGESYNTPGLPNKYPESMEPNSVRYTNKHANSLNENLLDPEDPGSAQRKKLRSIHKQSYQAW